MEVVRQITKEQLEKISKQQEDLGKLLTNLGVLETRKHAILHQIADLNKEIEFFKSELEAQYGAININLEDGSYTEIEKNQNE